MSEHNGHAPGSVTLVEVRSAAEELLACAGSQLRESGLFPYGINYVAVSVKAAGIEVSVEVSGPEHGPEEDEDEWPGEDLDTLFEEEDDER